jgi:hypothetical protein
MRRFALVSLLLLGCSSEEPSVTNGSGDAHGGSRLRPIVLVSDEGLRIPIAIHDSALGIGCEPRKTADNVLRCLPRTQSTALSGHLFADGACARQAGVQDPGFRLVDNFAFMYADPTSTCGDRVRVIRVRPISELFSDESGSCVRVEGGHWPAFEVLGEARPEEFAVVSRVSAARVDAETYEGEDGSRITLAFHPPIDTAFEVMCTPTIAGDGRERCLPMNTAMTVYYDASCSQSALTHAGCVSRPTYSRRDEVTSRTHVHDLGAPLPQVFSPAPDGTCAVASYPHPTFAIGPETDPSFFPSARRTTFGGARLAVRAIDLEGRILPDPNGWIDGRFLDVAKGQPCELFAAADDSYRCMPNDVTSVVFSDSSCTDPVAALWDEEHLPSLALEADGDFMTGAYAVRADLPRLTIKTYERYDGACVESYTESVLPVGSKMPLDSFPHVRRQIE